MATKTTTAGTTTHPYAPSRSTAPAARRGWQSTAQDSRLIAQDSPPDATGDVLRHYLYASRAHVPDVMIDVENTEIYRLITDHLGSVRLMVRVDDGSIGAAPFGLSFGQISAPGRVQPIAWRGPPPTPLCERASPLEGEGSVGFANSVPMNGFLSPKATCHLPP